MRIQKKRTKGWKMPANARCVDRRTRWGNPYSLKEYDRATALRLYGKWLDERLAEDPAFLNELKGKDLACWCSPSEACHADIIAAKMKEIKM